MPIRCDYVILYGVRVSRRLAITLRIAAIAVIGACLWWFIRKLDWHKLGKDLGHAKVWPLVIAVGLNFVCLWGKAACWHIMLAPKHVVKTMRLFRITVAAFAASAITPARAGEVLRVWSLKRRDGVPAADTAAVAVAEKLLDGMTMLILVAPVPWLLPGIPSWVEIGMLICAAIAVVLFIALYVAVGRVSAQAAGTGSFFTRFIGGMHVLRDPKRLLWSLVPLFMVWFADLGAVMLVMYAVGIDVPIAAGLLVLFTLNVTIMVPSTPAQVGAFEVGALAGCKVIGIAEEPALAFALLYHVMQVIPTIAAGLILEMRLVLGREGDVKAECPVEADADKRRAELPRATASPSAEIAARRT